MSEDELVERCKRGDQQAQRQLYEQTSARIYSFLLRNTANPEDAADLLQETYLRVFRGIDRFHGKCSVATWIYQVALNQTRQWARLLNRRKVETNVPQERLSANCEEASSPSAIEIDDAISRLTKDERAMIILRHFEGMSYREIAHVLGKPPGTIASGLNRAREKLRELLE
ncbi:MAG: putative alternative RNA polymerase sigma factor SigM [Phycisphaerae bacterium]